MNSNSKQKRISFGYNRGPANQIELHPTQALAVKLIYESYADRQSIASIIKMMENAEIPSPQNKSRWSKQTVANILSNPHYVGSTDYPQIIEQILYNSVQTQKTKRAQGNRL